MESESKGKPTLCAECGVFAVGRAGFAGGESGAEYGQKITFVDD